MEWRFELEGQEVQEPIGWENMQVRIVRDSEWHGMFTRHSVESLTFLCDGKDIIENYYESEGLDAKINLKIYYRCFDGQPWQLFFDGNIIVSDLKISEGLNLVNVTFEENKGELFIRNKSDTPIDLNSLLSISRPPTLLSDHGWLQFPALLDGNEISQIIYRRYRSRLSLGCMNDVVGYNATPMVLLSSFTNTIPVWNSSVTYSPGNFVLYYNGSLWEYWYAVNPQVGVPPGAVTGQWTNEGSSALDHIRVAGTYIAQKLNCPCIPASEVYERRCMVLHFPKVVTAGLGCANNVQIYASLNIGGFEVLNETGFSQVSVSAPVGYYGENITDALLFNPTNGSSTRTGGVSKTEVIDRLAIYSPQEVSNDAEYVISCNFRFCAVVGVVTEKEKCNTSRLHDYDYIKADLVLRVGNTVVYTQPIFNVSSPGNDTSNPNEFSNFVCVDENVSFSYSFGPGTLSIGQNIQLSIDFLAEGDYERNLSSKTQVDFYALVKMESLSDCCFDINFGSRLLQSVRSIISVYPIYETLNRIVEAITDGEVSVRSDFFGRPGIGPQSVSEYGCGSFLCITNGYYIRGFGTDLSSPYLPAMSCGSGVGGSGFVNVLWKKIYCTLSDVYKTIDAIYTVGMGMEYAGGKWWLRVESRDYFYDHNTIVLTINVEDGMLISLEKQVTKDKVYNLYVSGYEKWATNSVNGLYEFNTLRNWRIPLFSVKNELSSVSPYIGGGQTIEVTRRQAVSLAGTADYEYDEDNFVIVMSRLEDNTPGNLAAGIFSVAERGAGAPTQYLKDASDVLNWRIRPSVMARRRMPYIAGAVFHDVWGPNDWLVLSSGSANTSAEGQDVFHPSISSVCPNWGVTSESEGLSMSDLLGTGYITWYLRPEIYTAKLYLSISDYNLLLANPRGIIRFVTSSGNIDGFINEITYNPSSQEATIKIVRTV